MFLVLFALAGILVFHTVIFVRKYVRNHQRIRAVKEQEHLTNMQDIVTGAGGAAADGTTKPSHELSGSGSGSGSNGSGQRLSTSPGLSTSDERRSTGPSALLWLCAVVLCCAVLCRAVMCSALLCCDYLNRCSLGLVCAALLLWFQRVTNTASQCPTSN
jgi:hypothetical protein